MEAALVRLRAHASHMARSAFVRNVAVVMTGTAVAQAIGFALSPVISRLYTPAAFGVFGSFGAVAGVVGAAATLEYTQAVMLPKAREDALNVFLVACLCAFGASTLCLGWCLLAPEVVFGLVGARDAWIPALLVFATLVSGLNQAFQAWCVRVKAFRHTSASQVVRSVSSNGMQIGFGAVGAGHAGLILSSVVADAVASLNLVRVLLPDLKALRQDVRWQRMVQLAREYRDFPQYSATTNVLNTLSLGLPVLLLTQFYGVAIAGAYAFAERIISTPMSFVTRALRQVLFQKACEIHNEGQRLLPLFIKITAGMFAVALFPSLVFMAWAPELFGWVFGSQWFVAGDFARSLMLWLMFAFCNLPAVLFARIVRIQRMLFVFNVALLLSRTLALVFGGMYLPPVQTVLLFSVVGAVMNVWMIGLVGRALYLREGDVDWRQVMSEWGPQ